MTTINFDFQEKFLTGDAKKYIKYSQNPWEFEQWAKWIKEKFYGEYSSVQHRPFKYLEIGSYAGESLYYLSQILPKGSIITLVDLGDNPHARMKLMKEVGPHVFNTYGHKINLISGDSRDPEVVNSVLYYNDGARYDLVFIDANHTFEFAIEDFKNYRDKANWIVFHDISWFNTEKTKMKYGVYQANANHLWEAIKSIVPMDDHNGCLNWKEIVYEMDMTNKTELKARGFGILRSQW